MLKSLITKFQGTRYKKYKRKTKKIVFFINAPDASSVEVVGSFTSWVRGQHMMEKEKDGLWRTSMDLCNGNYEYKFVVDNNWYVDPSHSETVVAENGIVNSVKRVII